MTEEAIADSVVEEESSIDMDAAMDDITSSIFPEKESEESDEEVEIVEEIVEEEVTDALPEKEKDTAEEEVTKPLPQSWKKDMEDKWGSLDPQMQDYIEQREAQMREGLEKDRGDSNLGRTMRDVMSPYSEMLKSQGIDETAMVRNLMNAHYKISTADPATKASLFQQLKQSYGIEDGVESPTGIDPALKAMQDRLNGLETHISASHERTLQEARTRVESDVESFASDPKHEFFDEVAEQIIPLINAGYELEDAYQNAIWLNPVTRQKEIDRTSKEAAEKASLEAKQEVEKARKAKSANVRGRDTNRTPTEPTGTMEDTMRARYRELQNS